MIKFRVKKHPPFNGRLAMHSAILGWVKAHWAWLENREFTELGLYELIVETEPNYRELLTQANVLHLMEEDTPLTFITNAHSDAVNRPHHTGSTASAPLTPDRLNLRLCAKLGMVVHLNTAMTLDETFVSPYWRDQRGFAHAVLDFEHDLNETVNRIPKTVQIVLRWSVYEQKWDCMLLALGTGEFLAEAYAETIAEATAKALLGYLERIG